MSLHDLLIRHYLKENRFHDGSLAAGDIGLPTYGYHDAMNEEMSHGGLDKVSKETRERIISLMTHKPGMARQREFDKAFARRRQQTLQEINDKTDSELITYVIREFWLSAVLTACVVAFIVWLFIGSG